jgi:hypothetical protein
MSKQIGPWNVVPSASPPDHICGTPTASCDVSCMVDCCEQNGNPICGAITEPDESGACKECQHLAACHQLAAALAIADEHFGYPARGSAVDDECTCAYCRYARIRDAMKWPRA